MTTNVIDTGVETIRTGILGGGFMARVHSSAARASGADLRALASSTAGGARIAAAALGITRSEDDAEALLAASDIDLVHICTPNATHAALAAAAIRTGHHVICEKPLALDVAAARELVALAAAHGRVAAVPFVYRYHPMAREARARIRGGEVGSVLTVQCGYLQDWLLLPVDDDWRAGADGGPSRAFADIGSHLCDLLEFVTGERIARLTARTRTVFSERGGRTVDNEDIVAILAETAGGALATLLISQMAAGRKNALTLEVHGTAAALGFAQERPEELWIGRREGSALVLRDPSVDAPDAARLQTVPAGHPMGYNDAFHGFVSDVHAAIRGEAPEGMPTFADGLRAAVLTEAVLESARTRAWVEVTP